MCYIAKPSHYYVFPFEDALNSLTLKFDQIKHSNMNRLS